MNRQFSTILSYRENNGEMNVLSVAGRENARLIGTVSLEDDGVQPLGSPFGMNRPN